MGRRPNDGRGRLGGRAKGTKNKPTTPVLEWLNDFLSKQRHVVEARFSNGVETEQEANIYALLSVSAALMENTAAILSLMNERTTHQTTTNN